MAQLYTKKTWLSEVIKDSDMNRIENACSGRKYHVFANGTDGDFSTIAEAIAQVGTDGGGTIVLHGEFTLSATINLNVSHCALTAGPKGATIKKGVGLNAPSLYIHSAVGLSSVIIQGILFDGEKTSQAAGIGEIEIGKINNLIIKDNIIEDAYADGIHIDSNVNRNIWILDNVFSGIDGYPVNHDVDTSSERLWINKNRFASFKKSAIRFYGNSPEHVYITENNIDCSGQTSTYYGIETAAGVAIAYGVIHNNIIINVYDDAIHVASAGVEVTGNEIELCGGDGIHVSGSQFVVAQNIINNVDGHGINVPIDEYSIVTGNIINDVMFHGVYMQSSTQSSVVGNLIHNCSQASHNTYSGVKLVGLNSAAHANHVASNTANKHQYGVDESGTKNHVVGNSSHGHATGAVNVTGAGSQSSSNTGTV
jgi:hypothetical protein